MTEIRKQIFRIFLFILISALPALCVAFYEWPRFDWRFVVGGLVTFSLTSLSFLPALIGPAPRHLIYGAAFSSAGFLIVAIRVYFIRLPLSVFDLVIPFAFALAAILLRRYSLSSGGFKQSWRDIVAAVATVLGALSGFVWGIVTANPAPPL